MNWKRKHDQIFERAVNAFVSGDEESLKVALADNRAFAELFEARLKAVEK